MFDWNDEELTNIIWGEAGENDDHIVPFQKGNEKCSNKKEWSQETATVKSIEEKTSRDNVDLHGRKLECGSNLNANGGIATAGFGMGSWPELSLSNATKTEQDSLASEVSNNLAEVTKYSSLNAEKLEHAKDSEIFQNPSEDKEQGDFVDYSWANIGSFDDLERIFSNDDQIFGNVSLGSGDELWSSSKEVTNSPVKSFPTTMDSTSLGLGTLRSTAEHMEIKREYEQDNPPFTLSYRGLEGSTSRGLHHVEFPGDKRKSIIEEQTNLETGGKFSATKSHLVAEKVMTPNALADKAYRKKKLLKFRNRPEEVGEAKLLQDLYGTWTSSGNPLAQYENNLATSMVKPSPSSVIPQQRQLQRSDSLQYLQMPHTFVAPSTFGNLSNQYPAMPVLSNMKSGEFKQQPLLSCYDVSPVKANPINRSVKAAAKPLRMTPQEKIEKLRRRQQMQALLAIQKQHKQFSHQVPCMDPSAIQKSTQANQFQHVEGLDVEDLSTLATFDPNSPLEQDDSSMISVAVDDYSAEDTVLYRLQDIIAKLDVRIRIGIRDSLFRLAQSAMQRHHASDTSSTDKSGRGENEVVIEENKNLNRMSDAETETNPIDRTVAHLLFHRPLELSGKHPDTPESPASSKLSCEHKSTGLMGFSMGSISDNSQVNQNPAYHVTKGPSSLLDPQHVEQFKNSPCMDTSDNATNYGPADGVAAEVEASQ